MNEIIPSDHPYWHMRSFVKDCLNEIEILYFSYYEYIPQSLIDNRNIFSIKAEDFLDEKIVTSIFMRVPDGRELAFHSKVADRFGKIRHIPMVDMSTGSASQLAKLKPLLGEELFSIFKWYKSGRSYHGYGKILIISEDWASLMGKFLLANQKGLPPTVDPRWVGHRLIAGYSALRWTKKTPYYISVPKEV